MNNTDTEKLIQRLQQFPELEPPPALVSEVMGRIRPVKKPFWQHLLNYLTGPHHITLQPLRLAGAAMFAAGLAFFRRLQGRPTAAGWQLSAASKE